ncbi:uncharacterized protein PFL1_03493 [Pseudozyma flocculosa PF-1]|uniref:Uncharacterized protein n=2 Tax=Pseudozyma flocculosa TaxID=84751 RepID=A0A5C3FDF3_9BASI|nr:uncharacterized protein PFL1_03493 [Pseudozyma flocculosa PF-1]EPQ29206.1 hypothetical protein PFL1_03493 [Pseudozyma flocculosa PF-1]SPO41491.1 uncharacterized protein PSFLO_06973 [Pseudozyma flocculosa]
MILSRWSSLLVFVLVATLASASVAVESKPGRLLASDERRQVLAASAKDVDPAPRGVAVVERRMYSGDGPEDRRAYHFDTMLNRYPSSLSPAEQVLHHERLDRYYEYLKAAKKAFGLGDRAFPGTMTKAEFDGFMMDVFNKLDTSDRATLEALPLEDPFFISSGAIDPATYMAWKNEGVPALLEKFATMASRRPLVRRANPGDGQAGERQALSDWFNSRRQALRGARLDEYHRLQDLWGRYRLYLRVVFGLSEEQLDPALSRDDFRQYMQFVYHKLDGIDQADLAELPYNDHIVEYSGRRTPAAMRNWDRAVPTLLQELGEIARHGRP